MKYLLIPIKILLTFGIGDTNCKSSHTTIVFGQKQFKNKNSNLWEIIFSKIDKPYGENFNFREYFQFLACAQLTFPTSINYLIGSVDPGNVLR
jgi:hypothetical protein